MGLLEEIKAKAAARKKTIVLCEGEDSRVVEAAAEITKEGIAKIAVSYTHLTLPTTSRV